MIAMLDDAPKQPGSLIDGKGNPYFGQFSSPIKNLALDKFLYFNDMDKKANPFNRYFHYKQFQFISINTGKFIIGAAIADIRYLGSGFLYIYDINNNSIVEQSWLRPPTIGYKTSASPYNGNASIGSSTASIHFKINSGQWQLSINSKHIQANLTLTTDEGDFPLSMCSPTGYNGWTYTQKHNALSVNGQLTINQQPQNLSKALAGYDFSAGYMRRETSWRWASINGVVNEKSFGLNLAAGVNETGSSENVCWLGGKRCYLPPVHFKFQRQRTKQSNMQLDKQVFQQPWHIVSEAINSEKPRVELTFTPLNNREERLNLWLLKSNFRQYIGHYNGVIRGIDGNNLVINNILGLSEDHFARW